MCAVKINHSYASLSQGLNHLRTNVGIFQSSMHKWGLAPTSICECGAIDQTVSHLLLKCPLHFVLEDVVDCCSCMMRLHAGSTPLPPTFQEDLP